MVKRIMCLCMMVTLLTGCFAACASEKEVPLGQATTIQFWGWGTDTENQLYNRLVTEFNTTNDYNITVKYTPYPNENDFTTAAEIALSGNSFAPDVFYVLDKHLKRWATLGILEPMDSYVANKELNKEINLEEFWPAGVSRYYYDLNTKTETGPDAKLWAIPKDIGPTVLYYNASAFEKVGITIVSKDADDPTITPEESVGYNDAKKYSTTGSL